MQNPATRRGTIRESVCATCGSLVREYIRLPNRRIYRCLNGHTRIEITRGRPRVRWPRIGVCRMCGVCFEYLGREDRPIRRICSRRCARRRAWACRQKLPPGPVLRARYEAGASTPELAREFGVTAPQTVRMALLKAGTVLRRHTVTTVCLKSGCRKPVKKIKHAGNGSWYGRRCARHLQFHRATLTRHYKRRVKRIPAERWRIAI